MKKARTALVVILALAICIPLAACVPEASSTQKSSVTTKPTGTIKVLSFSEYHVAIQAAIDSYMKDNPGVTVTLEEYPYAQYNSAVSIKLGSSSSDFDVILTDATMVSNYAFKGWITPVAQYFTDAEKSQFVSALVKSGTYDGEFYSAPLCNSAQVLWYNKDLLTKAGVGLPSTDPKDRLTWENIVEMSQKVMANVNDSSVYGLTFEQVDRPYQLLPLANSLGANAFSDDGLTVDGYLNSDKFKTAMQWYSDIYNKYNISPKGTSAADSVGLFTAGKVAFMAGNIFDFGTFQNTKGLNYGYTAFPYFANGTPATPTDSWHVSLSKLSKNASTAADFIKYITLGKGNDVFLVTRNAFAARTSILNSYSTDAKYSEFPNNVFRLAAYEAQNTAYPRPITLAYGEFETIMDSTYSDIRNGADVGTALDSAVKQINTQMAMYK